MLHEQRIEKRHGKTKSFNNNLYTKKMKIDCTNLINFVKIILFCQFEY